MKTSKIWMSLLILLCVSCEKKSTHVIYQSDAFTVYDDRIEQDDFEARATSTNELKTNYTKNNEDLADPTLDLRFCINGRNNEFLPGEVHRYTVVPDGKEAETPVFLFGVPSSQVDADADELPYNTKLTVRVDISSVLNSFKSKGYYATSSGDTIYRDDFKGIYVAGNKYPLSWDYDNLMRDTHAKMQATSQYGIYEISLKLNPDSLRQPSKRTWKVELADLPARYPRFTSEQKLVDAVYNLSVDELGKLMGADSTYRADTLSTQIGTRNISYAVHLSLGMLNPEAAKAGLIAKVKNMRIIQDDGTGGSWPVATDRVVWTVAAWEIYKITGDKEWLSYAYTVIKNSLKDDLYTILDPRTFLLRGEQSYLNKSAQAYPQWMQPVNIYQSMGLSTNILHYQTYTLMSRMAAQLGYSGSEFRTQASVLRASILKYLWMEKDGYFGQYLYGGIYPILSTGSDALGQSLAVLFNVTTSEQSKSLIASMPVTPFGVTAMWPNDTDEEAYFNNAVWPFVQAYYTWAGKHTGNETAVTFGMASMLRATALFLSNNEMFTAQSGDYRLAGNPDNTRLWSVAGNLAMVYRVLFGIEFMPDKLMFRPMVPSTLPGKKTLEGLKYRNAELDITLNGTGNKIKQFIIDTDTLDAQTFVPDSLQGKHTVEITLTDDPIAVQSINMKGVESMPETSRFRFDKASSTIEIENFNDSLSYELYINGKLSGEYKDSKIPFSGFTTFTEVMAVPRTPQGLHGYSGKPIYFYPDTGVIALDMAAMVHTDEISQQGYSGEGYVTVSTVDNIRLDFNVTVPRSGRYFIDLRYANGSGPVNTDDKCALRTLYVNNERNGVFVMPQRGLDEWSNWGFSNPLGIFLREGDNLLSIRYVMPENQNMNGKINKALIDQIRLWRSE